MYLIIVVGFVGLLLFLLRRFFDKKSRSNIFRLLLVLFGAMALIGISTCRLVH